MVLPHLLLAATSAESPTVPVFNPYLLIAAGISWAALWVQFVVIPFFNKREQLHKDYSASGSINAALAAIEADELIPAISRMFVKLRDAQPDKRKRVVDEIEDLLQSVEFLPDLHEVQKAMSRMENIEASFQKLKLSASRLWLWGLGHSLVSAILPFVYVTTWTSNSTLRIGLLVFLGTVWFTTITASIAGLLRFHSRMGIFTGDLERCGANA